MKRPYLPILGALCCLLISCQKEHNGSKTVVADTWNPDLPTINNTGDSVTNKPNSIRRLSMSDELTFDTKKSAPGDSATLTAKCLQVGAQGERSQGYIEQTVVLQNPTSVKFARILPSKLIYNVMTTYDETANTKKPEVAFCDISGHLTNLKGSTKTIPRFSLNLTMDQLVQPDEAYILSQPVRKFSELNEQTAKHFRFANAGSESATAKLECEEFQGSMQINDSRETDISSLLMDEPATSKPTMGSIGTGFKDSRGIKPVQMCQVFLYENSGRAFFSAPLKVRFPNTALVYEVISDKVQDLKWGQAGGFELYKLKVRNPSAIDVHLKINKDPVQSFIAAGVFARLDENPSGSGIGKDFVYKILFKMSVAPEQIEKDDNSSTVFVLKAGQEAIISTVTETKGNFSDIYWWINHTAEYNNFCGFVGLQYDISTNNNLVFQVAQVFPVNKLLESSGELSINEHTLIPYAGSPSAVENQGQPSQRQLMTEIHPHRPRSVLFGGRNVLPARRTWNSLRNDSSCRVGF